MAALVTLAEAKLRVRVVEADTSFDADLTMKAQQATAIVSNYLKRPDDFDWLTVDATELSVVKAAILEVTRNLFEGLDPLPQFVKDILWRYRDPALA